jgi:molecular chaperone GrpE (heat shock protein)
MNTEPNSAQRETESSEKEKETLQRELAAEKDRYLRLAPDFDNFRKRTTQEMERRAAAQKDASYYRAFSKPVGFKLFVRRKKYA